MRRLLFVSKVQFGYLTDTYSHAQHLRGRYEVACLCSDYGLERLPVDGVRVVYVPPLPTKLGRVLSLVRAAVREIRAGGYDLVLAVYFPGCALLRLARHCPPAIVDVRTGSIRRRTSLRRLENALMRWECSAYRHISVISESLRAALRLPAARCTLLPLGGEPRAERPRDPRAMRLLYVGTLEQREIHLTIEAFGRFHAEHCGDAEISYDIVGDGPEEDRRLLLAALAASPARGAIRYHGYVPYARVAPFFASATYGVAFVPLRPWFQCQPPTKVFEYLLEGMPVLATATDENLRILDRGNGVLCADSAEGFYDALQTAFARRASYDPARIRAESLRYSWRAIVDQTMVPLLEAVAGGGR